MTGLFGVRVERRSVFYDWTLNALILRYQERTTSDRVTEPVVRDTQGCRNVLFT